MTEVNAAPEHPPDLSSDKATELAQREGDNAWIR
jgi:hypothetical protein